MSHFDLIVVGSGPGGYVAAIRAAQLKLKVAIIEREALGGICLNWGCIPTKALLKSAQVFEYLKHADEYGISVGNVQANFEKIIGRSRSVANGMSKGIQFLMGKNKITTIMGTAKLTAANKISVTDSEGKNTDYTANHIVLATGARSRSLPNLQQDGVKIIGYREAMSLPTQPQSMVVVGAGAIGLEFGYFYASLGTRVTIVEYLDRIAPNEDEEVSKELEKHYKKMGITVLTAHAVQGVDTKGNDCKVKITPNKGGDALEITCNVVLSAVGQTANIENIGLETLGIKTEKGLVVTDEFYRTNVAGVYAIGDITPGQALAHVASAEGIICVEKIAGHHPEPLDYNNIPACTYCSPEIASVGYTETKAKAAGYEVKVGKFPFTASGKAKAAGHSGGFVKLVFDAKYGELLGAHMIGYNVTEMIAEIVAARKLETTGHEIIKAVHPHPTMSEAVMEAAAAAYGEVIHL
ncbi:MAG: dihydrolipoyl dehydrogenase [Sphingobacteriales bacterium]|jgi:dihydrolipoamide dehydrogenase|nr:dihydrolipoyl dehydrogenase [Sphingobacteriales bacterium]MBP9141095.1 dihydrolipoyl dehydrogenase [Chitinophagales bacterium]MDA0197699.1 dihydrolipoyl dehydrogenase [Bacteroidota bacterium]MBK7528696.1 dihydrolipoyl dehydrogenase [Sphingobacteriales bacterium]MBK8679336.1 dihydrolipoyl dehydrogenase [Sphingobacteriales bacterium]